MKYELNNIYMEIKEILLDKDNYYNVDDKCLDIQYAIRRHLEIKPLTQKVTNLNGDYIINSKVINNEIHTQLEHVPCTTSNNEIGDL